MDPFRTPQQNRRRRSSSSDASDEAEGDVAAPPPSPNGSPFTLEKQVRLAGGDLPSCDHLHTPSEGIHKAVQLADGDGYTFPHGDCDIVAKDGKIIRVNKLTSLISSEFLNIAFSNRNFAEGISREIKISIFDSTQILDAFELSSWVLIQWNADRKYPVIKDLSFSCALNVLRVAAFFQMEPLLESLRKTIVVKAPSEDLIEVYRTAELTNGELSQALWKRILADFRYLVQNGLYIQLSPKELDESFKDPKLNLKKTEVYEALEAYILASNDAPEVRREEIQEILGAPNAIEVYEDCCRTRIPYEIIIALGGRNSLGRATSSVELYNPNKDNWTQTKSLEIEGITSPRMFQSICGIEAGILCSGGFDGQRHFSSCFFYSFEEMKWKPSCSTLEARCDSGLTNLGGGSYAFLCGGYNGQTRHKSAEVYFPEENRWKNVASMAEARSSLCTVTIPESNKVYAIGGFDGALCLSTVEVYSPEKNQWFPQFRRMNERRGGHGSVLLDNNNVIIAMGGSHSFIRLNSTEMLDIREGRWHQLSDMKKARTDFGAVNFEGSAWVIGGNTDSIAAGECERFDLRKNAWIEAESMTAARVGHACCSVKNVEWIEKMLAAPST